jgi:outer membrane protein assembly factor BamB
MYPARDRKRCVMTTALFCLIVSFASNARLLSDDWAQFGGSHRNFKVVTDPALDRSERVVPWRASVREGDDAPIVSGNRVFVSESLVTDDGGDAHRLTCRNLETGELVWQQNYPVQRYESQDISPKYPVRPIATSCVANDRIVCVGYSGSVHCFRTSDGQQEWSHDLVDEFGAAPVQFGSGTSPWSDGDIVAVACGGEQALVMAFRLDDGAVAWKCGSGPASYTSLIELPMLQSESEGAFHLVYAAGNELIGIHPRRGSILWRVEYPKAGLTNAVTPLVIGPGELVVGGQGFDASAMLRIRQASDGTYTTETVWKNSRVKPFYCNWIMVASENMIVGFAGKTLFGLDASSGKLLWQERGWTDSNVSQCDEHLLIVRGDGVVAKVLVTAKGLKVQSLSIEAMDRVWSPPTIVGRRVLLRGRTSLSCLDRDAFQPASKMPAGNEVTSMEAMYGK